MPLAQTRLECLQILKLLQCIRERDWTQMEKLVVHGVPDIVNYTDPTLGETPISVAASNDDLEMVERLLRLGASPNAVDGKGRTAVMRAAQMGNYACVELFVKTRTANLKIQDTEGKDVLFYCMAPTEKHEKCAELAISSGADVNSRNKKGTPLIVCACERAVELDNFCLLLLSNGANPNSEDEKTKRTALMAAASVGSGSVVSALLRKGSDVGCVMVGSKIHVVHEAAKGGHISVLQMLSGCGAEFDVLDDHKNSPLHLAAKERHAMCCKFLVQRGCNPKVKNDQGYTARMLAKEEGSKSTIRECRRAEKAFGKPSKNDAWTIRLYDFCCEKADQLRTNYEALDGDEIGRICREDFIEVLKESKAPLPVKQTDIERLMAAHETKEAEGEREGRYVDYELFLSGKKCVDKAYRMSAFDKKRKKKKKKSRQKRAKKGKTKVAVPICIQLEVERREDGGPPGAFVPRHVHLTDPKRFDEIRLPRHVLQDDSKWYYHPPEQTYMKLNDAIRHLDVDTLQLSMRRSKEIIHWRDKYFKTPLMIAAHEGNLSLVTYLIENGADVNATDNFKWTALHFACRKGHLGVIEHLLRNGAKVNAITMNGGSPIMRAIESGSPDVVQLLIDHGADLRVETRKGKSPVDLAAAYGDPRVYDMIKAKWAALPPAPPASSKKKGRGTQQMLKSQSSPVEKNAISMRIES